MSGHLLSQVLRALARYTKRNNAFSLIIPVVTSVTATGNVSGFPGIGSLSAVPQAPDQSGASAALALARNLVDGALARLAEQGAVDADQVVAYDLAHAPGTL